MLTSACSWRLGDRTTTRPEGLGSGSARSCVTETPWPTNFPRPPRFPFPPLRLVLLTCLTPAASERSGRRKAGAANAKSTATTLSQRVVGMTEVTPYRTFTIASRGSLRRDVMQLDPETFRHIEDPFIAVKLAVADAADSTVRDLLEAAP